MTIRAVFIYEFLGKPAEHIKTGMEEFVGKIENNKNVRIIRKDFHEPKKVDKEGVELWTCFSEVEIEIEELIILFNMVLNTLPSHVEIIEPSRLEISNFDLSSVLSELAMKLHKYDEVAKIMAFERNEFENRLKEIEGKGEKKDDEGEVKKDE